MRELERTKEAETGGLLQEELHKELVDEIMSLTEEEVQLVIHLLASSPT